MAYTYYRPRGDIKANWEAVNPILKEREMGIEWAEIIGVGPAKIKWGNGGSNWNDLDYGVIDEITEKQIGEIVTYSGSSYPSLTATDTIATMAGKFNKLSSDLSDLKSDLTVLDISDAITWYEDYNAETARAYYKAGWVYLSVAIQAVAGDISYGEISSEYAPRYRAFGFPSFNLGSQSYVTIYNAKIHTDNTIKVYATEDMPRSDYFTFIYPLRA